MFSRTPFVVVVSSSLANSSTKPRNTSICTTFAEAALGMPYMRSIWPSIRSAGRSMNGSTSSNSPSSSSSRARHLA